MITVTYGKPKKLSCEQSIFVTFPYKSIIVDVIRSFPERVYNPNEKSWELPFFCLEPLKERLSSETFCVTGQPINSRVYGEKHINKYTVPTSLCTDLYEYQKDGMDEMLSFDRYLLLYQQGLGKAQPLYSKVLTPNGFITMGEVQVGTDVIGEDGKPHKVLGVFPQGEKDTYELTFSDGSKCRCSDEHLWYVKQRKKWKIMSVNDLICSGLYDYVQHKRKTPHKNWKYQIPITKEVVFENKDVNIDPWLLGVILGDGGITHKNISIANTEEDIEHIIRRIVELDDMGFHKYGYGKFAIVRERGKKYNKYISYLTDLGLMGHDASTKFIPDVYKYNSAEVRLGVLSGLFSTDGYVGKSAFSYKTISKRLADDIIFLVQSLGGTCTRKYESYITKATKKERLTHTLFIKLPNDLMMLRTEKQLMQYSNKNKRRTGVYRSLRSIKYIGKEECQCIYIDNPSHLYLTDDFIVTHNTVVSIAVALKRNEMKQVKHCLVVCGINGLKYNWFNEIHQHSTVSAKILGNRKNKKGIRVSGSTQDKLDDLNNFNEFFLVTNVESLRNKEIRDKLKDLMKKNIIEMIIFDELQCVKSSSSQQGKSLLLLSKYVKYFYGLTGTPLMNNPLDLYVPLKLVGKENANFYGFSHRYAIYGGFGGYEVIGMQNLDELQQKLDDVSLRKKKSDVLNLPPKIYIDEYVELGKKQRKIYDDVLKMIMENIDEISLSPDPLGQMIRLRQATADTSILSSTIKESAKIDRLKEIVKEVVDNGESCLIFSSWTTVTDILERELKEYKPAVITGKVKDREEQKKKFMEDKDCHILIGTIAAMSTGLTLTKATNVIFMDEPYTMAAKQQAEDRAHRIGTTSSINIITLMAKNTIDEYIHKLVMRKGVMSDSIVDAKYDVKDKEVLKYILTGEGNIEKGNVNDAGK